MEHKDNVVLSDKNIKEEFLKACWNYKMNNRWIDQIDNDCNNHISVIGSIGVGKSTFCNMIKENSNVNLVEECVKKNPYLELFYLDSKKYAFQTQMFFLTHRLKNYYEAESNKNITFFDRHFIEDSIFAKTALDEDFMTERDYNTYMELFTTLRERINNPKIILYFYATPETCLKRINKRNRIEESSGIPLKYLQTLEKNYELFIESMKNKGSLILKINWEKFVSFDVLLDELTKKICQKNKSSIVNVF